MHTLGINASKNEMDAMMNEIDSKGTGEIDLECNYALIQPLS
jgi:Ca2+-binding EF-hand superfamily protein